MEYKKSSDQSLSLGFYKFLEDQQTSALEKYKTLVVADEGYCYFFKYELLQLLFGNMPSSLGILLRHKLYRSLFKNFGKKVFIGCGVSLRQPKKISIGSGCIIDDYCRLSARGSDKAEIVIGDNVFVGRNTVLNAREGQLKINNFSNIGSFCRISARGQTTIGQYVLIGAFCYVGAGNHVIGDIHKPMALQESESRGPVTIEDDVWLGAHVTVLDAVSICTGSVIGAGSVVTKDIPPYSVAYGIPAKVVRKRR